MAVAAPSRSRASGGRLFIIVGAVLALLAFVLVLFFGRTGGSSGGSGGPTTKVLVAARDVALRTQLTAADLQFQDYSTALLPTTVKPYTKMDDIVKAGLIAEINIAKGQLITQNMLAQQGDLITGAQPAYLPIPQGFVAVTIPAGGEINGVAGFIQAGDYISMIATVQLAQLQPPGAAPSTTGPISATKTVFQNLHILRLGPAATAVQPASGGAPPASGGASSGQAGGITTSMTVVVTACDAEYLTWMTTNAQIKYELESFKDYQPQDTKPDPSCASVLVTKGVTSKQVEARFGFTKI